MLLDIFSSWWQGLELLAKIYWLVTIPFSILFVIELVITFMGASSTSDGLDASDDTNTSIDIEDGISFQIITLKNIVAFFTIFGWTGLACIDSQLTIPSIIIVSAVCGLIMMILMAGIYYYVGKLNEKGMLEINRAIGVKATVYLQIPPQRKGTGKIQIKLQGLRTLDAMTDEAEAISPGSLCEVVGILMDEVLLVRKL